ncbi:uncharacterized protein Bfra_010639 [Botrytis fragariae]|uniref:Uncharacterized protein n=1 Tax=Botrytis fragariae TaxID=1964551 RepID=A0A8H6AHY5_9HELO|nr:uncharacterized protein Bfra_010639 [Botrytis fragariae]KAF5867670.1 hypothetical protein Bfra_010639 [Botrytis fragariae]
MAPIGRYDGNGFQNRYGTPSHSVTDTHVDANDESGISQHGLSRCISKPLINKCCGVVVPFKSITNRPWNVTFVDKVAMLQDCNETEFPGYSCLQVTFSKL